MSGSSHEEALEISTAADYARLLRQTQWDGADLPALDLPETGDELQTFDPPLVSLSELDDFQTFLPGLEPVDPPGPLPVSLTSATGQLLDHYRFAYERSTALVDPKFKWLSYAFSDPVLFHAILVLSAAHLGASTGTADVSSLLHYHRSELISLISDRLEQDRDKQTDQTIAAVALLAHYESVVVRNVVNCGIHRAGLSLLIRVRGGLQTLGMEGLTARAVVWADMSLSLSLGTLPSIPALNAPNEATPTDFGIPSQSSLLYAVHLGASLHFYGQATASQASQIAKIFCGLRYLSALKVAQSTSPSSTQSYSDKLELLERRLLTFLDSTNASLGVPSSYMDIDDHAEMLLTNQLISTSHTPGTTTSSSSPTTTRSTTTSSPTSASYPPSLSAPTTFPSLSPILALSSLLYLHTHLRSTPPSYALPTHLTTRLAHFMAQGPEAIDWPSRLLRPLFWALVLGARCSLHDRQQSLSPEATAAQGQDFFPPPPIFRPDAPYTFFMEALARACILLNVNSMADVGRFAGEFLWPAARRGETQEEGRVEGEVESPLEGRIWDDVSARRIWMENAV